MTGDSTVAGVLLAAGDSDRFGERDKLLADFDGDPLVRHAARTLTDADLGPIAAVVGPESTAVGDSLAGLDIAVVETPEAAAGQSTSVRRGVAWARERADAAVFALGDMPLVDSETVDRLVAAYNDGRGSALAAGYEERRGNPVLFDERHFDALAALDGDTGGHGVFEGADDAAVVGTGDPGVRVDVDTPGDLDELR